MQVKDIIKEAVTISEDASFADAVSLMVSKQTNSLLAINNNGELVGEVYMSDMLDAVVPEYLDGDSIAAHFATTSMFEEAVRDAREIKVKLFMDTKLAAVSENEGIMSIAATALAAKKVHLPVVDANNKPVGMISRRGLKLIVADILGIKDAN